MQNNNTKRKHKVVGTLIKVKGRVVGQVIGDTFTKDITNRHMLTDPAAIATDIQTLRDAENAGALYCEFPNIETGIIYRVSFSQLWSIGRKVNFGWGEQQMLTLPNWMQTRDPNFATDEAEYSEPNNETHATPLHYVSNAPKGSKYTKAPKQMGLFG